MRSERCQQIDARLVLAAQDLARSVESEASMVQGLAKPCSCGSRDTSGELQMRGSRYRRAYVARQKMPAPGGYVGSTAVWRRSTIEEWQRAHPERISRASHLHRYEVQRLGPDAGGGAERGTRRCWFGDVVVVRLVAATVLGVAASQFNVGGGS